MAKLKYLIKYNKVLRSIYQMIGSTLIRALSKFIKVQDNYILFVVYGGQRYDDSPKEIYEYMKQDKRFQNFHFHWAFIHPEKIEEVMDDKIKIDTFSYYKTALKCKYWITNSSAERGLKFKPKETIDIFFTHGMTGIKKIGLDMNDNTSFKMTNKGKMCDYIVIEGKKEEEILKKAWNLKEEKILNIGLPRNDELVHYTPEHIKFLKEKLHIPFDKKVILYAPTFREYKRDSSNAVYLKPPFDFDRWYKELGDQYVLLLTAHYEIAKLMDIPKDHPFIINAFKYPHINDLMLVSDLLITDYSSIIFDYSILGKPIIAYAYDYEQYKSERGIYEGYEQIFKDGILKSEEDVIKTILHMNYDVECLHTKENIRDYFITDYGDVTEKAVNLIFGDTIS